MPLNKFSYFGDFGVCLATLFGLAAATVWGRSAGALLWWMALFALGGGIWTLAEYLVHRWVYHKLPVIKNYHEAHHVEPRALLGSPVGLGVVVIFSFVYLPLRPIDALVASGLTSGILFGYFAYMLVHHAIHHWSLRRGTCLYRTRLRHAAHHYHSDSGNFGVTTPLWDTAFGTCIERKPSSLRA
jgi:sterol desaturase/sphingolipid hydroxylase (fatty acid hydroxylase superfamily)